MWLLLMRAITLKTAVVAARWNAMVYAAAVVVIEI